MDKGKKKWFKIATSTLILAAIGASFYIGTNNFVPVAATDETPSNQIYASTEVEVEQTILAVVADESTWTTLDEEVFLTALREEIRNDMLDSVCLANGLNYEWALENDETFEPWEPTDKEIEEWIELEMMWRAYRTPRPYHLTEDEMIAIGIQWVYEEFGAVVDMSVMLDENSGEQWFMSEFNYGLWEDRAFWSGSFSFYENYFLINSYTFVVDGTTGKRLMIEDMMLPFEPIITELIWEQTQVTVLDQTIVSDINNPWSSNMIPEDDRLSLDALVNILMERIKEIPGVNLDELTIAVNFWSGEDLDTWNIGVELDAPFTEGRAFLESRYQEMNIEGQSWIYQGQCSNVNHRLILNIDAQTGEIVYFEDTRELSLETAVQLCH